VCGDTFADVRVHHKGNVIDHVIEGAYEVLRGFELVRVAAGRAGLARVAGRLDSVL